jgi:peptidoglycan/LPS O-acetylase OafA/YrhL
MNLPLLHLYYVAAGLTVFLLLFFRAPSAKASGPTLAGNIARHSYSIYIVHQPLFSYLGVMPTTVTHTLLNFAFLTAILLPLSYMAASILDFASAAFVKRVLGTADN